MAPQPHLSPHILLNCVAPFLAVRGLAALRATCKALHQQLDPVLTPGLWCQSVFWAHATPPQHYSFIPLCVWGLVNVPHTPHVNIEYMVTWLWECKDKRFIKRCWRLAMPHLSFAFLFRTLSASSWVESMPGWCKELAEELWHVAANDNLRRSALFGIPGLADKTWVPRARQILGPLLDEEHAVPHDMLKMVLSPHMPYTNAMGAVFHRHRVQFACHYEPESMLPAPLTQRLFAEAPDMRKAMREICAIRCDHLFKDVHNSPGGHMLGLTMVYKHAQQRKLDRVRGVIAWLSRT
jgi:hypothetical protein